MYPDKARHPGFIARLGAAVLLLVFSGAFFVETALPAGPRTFPRGKRGQEAISAIGSRIDKIARRHKWSGAKLRQTLLKDHSLVLSESEDLYYVCEFDLPHNLSDIQPASPAMLDGPLPYDQTFQLHSLPGATKTIYLDFDGHTTTGTYWNSQINGGDDIVSAPYDINDGSGASFSTAELDRIQYIWQRVAEDYSIYQIDVTTEDPGPDGLKKSNSSDQTYGVRVVISPSNWYLAATGRNAGGVAYLGSFDWGTDTPVFVISSNLGNGHEKYVAEAASHETGHALGLRHDGDIYGATNQEKEYYRGHGDWAPIMGSSYYAPVTQFSRGEYYGANNYEDDLAVMQNYGADYRLDDHGNSLQTATAMGGPNVFAGGVIERQTDIDVFSFQTGAGTISISADPAPREPNLDIALQLLNASGQLVVADNPGTALSAGIDRYVPAGTYYLVVDGVGTGNPSTGYSDYGSVGQYTLSGTIVTGAGTPSAPISPSPADNAAGQPIDTVLSWQNGGGATSYDVYFGTSQTPGFMGSQTGTGFDPGILAYATAYYWRIDAVNAYGTTVGSLWRFTTEAAPPGGGGSTYSEDFESSLGSEWSSYKSNGTYGRNEISTYSA
ncbi:MAG: hypothetical protein V2J11_03855, partial [Desulfofustis sp.]|nr:hypothetical protein [Desulfofustis sp.]